MYLIQLAFNRQKEVEAEIASDVINVLLAVLRMNGQVCGREWPITSSATGYIAIVMISDSDSLAPVYNNVYVSNVLQRLISAGLEHPQITQMEKDIDGLGVCRCTTPVSYILFTNYLSLEVPLRCGECFLPVPLYQLPHTSGEGYHDIICWQSDYQSCDSLQMHTATLERAATRELSKLDSSLSKQGIAICDTITRLTDKPTYYYLYRYGARSQNQELKRRCPSCDGEWLLDTAWHLFDFKCDTCHLLSNIAWDVRNDENNRSGKSTKTL